MAKGKKKPRDRELELATSIFLELVEGHVPFATASRAHDSDQLPRRKVRIDIMENSP